MKKLILFCLLAISFTCFAQKSNTTPGAQRPANLSDSALLELTQKQTLKYFWDFAHPVSGMARERSNVDFGYGNEVVTTGGTGFGIMAIIVGVERGWIARDTAARLLLKMVNFLSPFPTIHPKMRRYINSIGLLMMCQDICIIFLQKQCRY